MYYLKFIYGLLPQIPNHHPNSKHLLLLQLILSYIIILWLKFDLYKTTFIVAIICYFKFI